MHTIVLVFTRSVITLTKQLKICAVTIHEPLLPFEPLFYHIDNKPLIFIWDMFFSFISSIKRGSGNCNCNRSAEQMVRKSGIAD
jgi:hypothetical protein